MSQNSNINQTVVLAGLVGQVGCVTGLVAIVIIAIAFGVGRFLDAQFDIQGIFTVLFLVLSFPITLYAMVRISLQMVQRAQKQVEKMDREQQPDALKQDETSSTGENT